MNWNEMSEIGMWKAIAGREKGHDGRFVYGVLTTGVYCRPSCSSRQPKKQNVRYFRDGEQARMAGFRACRKCHPDSIDSRSFVPEVCRYIREHLEDRLPLAVLAKVAKVSPFTLQRKFTAEVGMSPRKFVETCRLDILKRELQTGKVVTSAMMAAGYSSTSRMYEQAPGKLGMAPRQYARGAQGVAMRISTVDTTIGPVVVAETERGICSVQFLDGDMSAHEVIEREFPGAELIEAKPDARIIEAIRAAACGGDSRVEVPLDLRGSVFQQKVWEELRRIPSGATRSYSQVAKSLGRPSASRAVARACATNHVAMLIPCHRVVRGDGELAGYRWGVERKRSLLKTESKKAAPARA